MCYALVYMRQICLFHMFDNSWRAHVFQGRLVRSVLLRARPEMPKPSAVETDNRKFIADGCVTRWRLGGLQEIDAHAPGNAGGLGHGDKHLQLWSRIVLRESGAWVLRRYYKYVRQEMLKNFSTGTGTRGVPMALPRLVELVRARAHGRIT